MVKTAYVNGTIITVNANNDIAEAILMQDGRIAAVGGTAEILALADADTQTVDLAGKTMLPGFIDPHGHIVAVAQTLLLLDFSACNSRAEMQERIAAKLRDDPPEPGEGSGRPGGTGAGGPGPGLLPLQEDVEK